MPYFERGWHRSPDLIDTNPGTIMKSTRAFGVEIECQYDDEYDIEILSEDSKVNKNIGIGSDGSINGQGVEIRTPPASGKAGENMIRGLCSVLKERCFDVDNSCGLHVHIDASDMKDKVREEEEGYKIAKNYWLFYIVMDDVIRSFLPPSRRRNDYCKPCESVYRAVHDAKSLMDLMLIYESSDSTLLDANSRVKYKDPTRYRGINLISLWREWHAEIRYHNGTLQGERILHWAYLHCLIMDKIMDGTITLAWIESMRATKGDRKTHV